MNMSERVYIPGRGPRQHEGVGFGVSQLARTAKSQVNIGVLQWKLRSRLYIPPEFRGIPVFPSFLNPEGRNPEKPFRGITKKESKKFRLASARIIWHGASARSIDNW